MELAGSLYFSEVHQSHGEVILGFKGVQMGLVGGYLSNSKLYSPRVFAKIQKCPRCYVSMAVKRAVVGRA